ncbi:Transmembrane protein 87A [Varanus komodoensis]|nr:Transmembrane protein 87A [Varanus komodoensis]
MAAGVASLSGVLQPRRLLSGPTVLLLPLLQVLFVQPPGPAEAGPLAKWRLPGKTSFNFGKILFSNTTIYLKCKQSAFKL